MLPCMDNFFLIPRRDGTKIAAVAQWGGLWRSSDSGATWANTFPSASSWNWRGITSSADGTRLAAFYHLGMVSVGGSQGWAYFGGNIYLSSDSGTSWQQAMLGVPGSSPCFFWSSIAMSRDGSKIVAVAANPSIPYSGLWGYNITDSGLFVSTDYGANFQKKPGISITNVGGSVIMSASGKVIFYTDTNRDSQAGYPKLWKSFDMDATWTSSPIMWDTEGSNLGDIATSADGGTLVAMGHKLYSTKDYGASWTSHSDATAGNLFFKVCGLLATELLFPLSTEILMNMAVCTRVDYLPCLLPHCLPPLVLPALLPVPFPLLSLPSHLFPILLLFLR